MAKIDCHVLSGKSALIPLDDLFPECKIHSSKCTPRLICLPEPNTCSECKSLGTLVQRVSSLFLASEWKLVVLYWYEEKHLKGLIVESKDPAEVRLSLLNQAAFKILCDYSEQYVIDLGLYT